MPKKMKLNFKGGAEVAEKVAEKSKSKLLLFLGVLFLCCCIIIIVCIIAFSVDSDESASAVSASATPETDPGTNSDESASAVSASATPETDPGTNSDESASATPTNTPDTPSPSPSETPTPAPPPPPPPPCIVGSDIDQFGVIPCTRIDSDSYSNDFVRYYNPALEHPGSDNYADAIFCKIKDDTNYFGSETSRPLNKTLSVDNGLYWCKIKNSDYIKVDGDPNSIDFYENCCKAPSS